MSLFDESIVQGVAFINSNGEAPLIFCLYILRCLLIALIVQCQRFTKAGEGKESEDSNMYSSYGFEQGFSSKQETIGFVASGVTTRPPSLQTLPPSCLQVLQVLHTVAFDFDGE